MQHARFTSRRLGGPKPVYLICWQSDSGPRWLYLEVDSLKRRMFERTLAQPGTVDMAHFGRIVFQGEGAEPPESARTLLTLAGVIEG